MLVPPSRVLCDKFALDCLWPHPLCLSFINVVSDVLTWLNQSMLFSSHPYLDTRPANSNTYEPPLGPISSGASTDLAE